VSLVCSQLRVEHAARKSVYHRRLAARDAGDGSDGLIGAVMMRLASDW
jgi:hypothetical protein